MKEFITGNAFNIGALLVGCVIAWATIQANSDAIFKINKSIEALDIKKVSNSTLTLKEQFLQSQLMRIEEEIKDLNVRLDKKIRIINNLEEEVHCLTTLTAVLQTENEHFNGQLANIWQNYNRINCK